MTPPEDSDVEHWAIPEDGEPYRLNDDSGPLPEGTAAMAVAAGTTAEEVRAMHKRVRKHLDS